MTTPEKDIPVYLFIGFLDSGKTTFIQQTLEEPDFEEEGKTLLLLTEQGEAEYNPDWFQGDVEIITVEEEEELTPDALRVLTEDTDPARVIIEYNGMWKLDSLFDSFPESWVLNQIMMFADARTYPAFDKNMRPLSGDKLTCTQLVIFNRMNDTISKEELHRIVRTAGRSAQIIFEYEDGHAEEDTIQDPLPFDIDAEVITIKDIDYAIWYQDMMTEPEKYEGKTVKFRAQLATADDMNEHLAAAGRFVMTCCEEDVSFCGMVADWGSGKAPQSGWFVLGGKIVNEYCPVYGKVGPVLKVLASKPSKKPKEEIATFY